MSNSGDIGTDIENYIIEADSAGKLEDDIEVVAEGEDNSITVSSEGDIDGKTNVVIGIGSAEILKEETIAKIVAATAARMEEMTGKLVPIEGEQEAPAA